MICHDFRRGFCTPLVLGTDPEALVIAPGTLRIVAYGATDGVERWRVAGLPNEICSSPIAGAGLIYCAGWTPGAGVARMPDFDRLLAADGWIAIASQSGTIAVVAAADELEVLSRNPLGEAILATPALGHAALYVRGRQHLWAFKAERR